MGWWQVAKRSDRFDALLESLSISFPVAMDWHRAGQLISYLLGWAYMAAWSLSFWPQGISILFLP
jgi:hypothetical protein